MPSENLYKQVQAINQDILASLKDGDIESTLQKLRERDECFQGGITNLQAELINRDQVLPILEEIIKQDNEITELLNAKMDNLRSKLTSASDQRKLRQNYSQKSDEPYEPRFIDTQG